MLDPTADAQDVAKLTAGEHGEPFAVLGPHAVQAGGAPALAIRAFLPEVKSAAVKHGGELQLMQRIGGAGFFEAVFPNIAASFAYELAVTYPDGGVQELVDPYALPPVLTDFDLHLFNEGTNYQLYAKLGAHLGEHAGHRGTSFAVWAPNALRVSVIGSFNRWDERRHPMRRRGASGIWEIFIPGVDAGALYKFHIKTRVENANSVKADPLGFAMEMRPNTASVVYDLRRAQWNDAEWMASRAARHAPGAPLSIYEVHLGSWRRGSATLPGAGAGAGTIPSATAGAGTPAATGAAALAAADPNRWLTYRELAQTLVPYAKQMGYTHLELMPVMEHPFDGSWGYQTVGYFAPTSRFGSPDDFRYLIDAAHRAGLGVILDWVPAHFPKDGHGLVFFDGTHLYEHADPRQGVHKDWDTFVFNYGRHEVCALLLSSALFWLDEYHVDGLRVDAVASMLYLDYSRQDGEWVPNEKGGRENLEAVAFLQRLNELLHKHFPDVLTFAEESTAWPGVSRAVADGGLGFDLKWNMGWMNDTLAYVREDPLARRYHQRRLTFSLVYAFSEKFLLPLSHDEVVHGKGSLLQKMPGDAWRSMANVRLLYGYMFTSPGKKLLFMGGEFGQEREWNHDRQLDWELLAQPAHAALQTYVRELNRIYAATPALHELDFDHTGFEWIDFKDEARSVLAYIRRARDPEQFVIVVANWTPVTREGYRIGVPIAGEYRQILNSDAARFGGSDWGMIPRIESSPEPAQRRPYSLVLTLPPLALVILEPVRGSAPALVSAASQEIVAMPASIDMAQAFRTGSTQATKSSRAPSRASSAGAAKSGGASSPGESRRPRKATSVKATSRRTAPEASKTSTKKPRRTSSSGKKRPAHAASARQQVPERAGSSDNTKSSRRTSASKAKRPRAASPSRTKPARATSRPPRNVSRSGRRPGR